jgi:hypothetical protein
VPPSRRLPTVSVQPMPEPREEPLDI